MGTTCSKRGNKYERYLPEKQIAVESGIYTCVTHFATNVLFRYIRNGHTLNGINY